MVVALFQPRGLSALSQIVSRPLFAPEYCLARSTNSARALNDSADQAGQSRTTQGNFTNCEPSHPFRRLFDFGSIHLRPRAKAPRSQPRGRSLARTGFKAVGVIIFVGV